MVPSFKRDIPVKNYFSILEPLRFAAALGVAVFHLTFCSPSGQR